MLIKGIIRAGTDAAKILEDNRARLLSAFENAARKADTDPDWWVNAPASVQSWSEEVSEIRRSDIGPITIASIPVKNYRHRTLANAAMSDATIAVSPQWAGRGKLSTGEAETAFFGQGSGRPVFGIDPDSDLGPQVDEIVDVLNQQYSGLGRGIVINGAGNSQSTLTRMRSMSVPDDVAQRLIDMVIEHPRRAFDIAGVRTGGQSGYDLAIARAAARRGIRTKILTPQNAGNTIRMQDPNGEDLAITTEGYISSYLEDVLSGDIGPSTRTAANAAATFDDAAVVDDMDSLDIDTIIRNYIEDIDIYAEELKTSPAKFRIMMTNLLEQISAENLPEDMKGILRERIRAVSEAYGSGLRSTPARSVVSSQRAAGFDDLAEVDEIIGSGSNSLRRAAAANNDVSELTIEDFISGAPGRRSVDEDIDDIIDASEGQRGTGRYSDSDSFTQLSDYMRISGINENHPTYKIASQMVKKGFGDQEVPDSGGISASEIVNYVEEMSEARGATDIERISRRSNANVVEDQPDRFVEERKIEAAERQARTQLRNAYFNDLARRIARSGRPNPRAERVREIAGGNALVRRVGGMRYYDTDTKSWRSITRDVVIDRVSGRKINAAFFDETGRPIMGEDLVRVFGCCPFCGVKYRDFGLSMQDMAGPDWRKMGFEQRIEEHQRRLKTCVEDGCARKQSVLSAYASDIQRQSDVSPDEAANIAAQHFDNINGLGPRMESLWSQIGEQPYEKVVILGNASRADVESLLDILGSGSRKADTGVAGRRVPGRKFNEQSGDWDVVHAPVISEDTVFVTPGIRGASRYADIWARNHGQQSRRMPVVTQMVRQGERDVPSFEDFIDDVPTGRLSDENLDYAEGFGLQRNALYEESYSSADDLTLSQRITNEANSSSGGPGRTLVIRFGDDPVYFGDPKRPWRVGSQFLDDSLTEAGVKVLKVDIGILDEIRVDPRVFAKFESVAGLPRNVRDIIGMQVLTKFKRLNAKSEDIIGQAGRTEGLTDKQIRALSKSLRVWSQDFNERFNIDRMFGTGSNSLPSLNVVSQATKDSETIARTLKNIKNQPVKRMPMNYTDGENGLTMLPDYRNLSTFDLVVRGIRTATTRKSNPKVKVGDVIEFYDNNDRTVKVVVTSEPVKLGPGNSAAREAWSRKEGWEPRHYDKYVGAWQFQYRLVDDARILSPLVDDVRIPNPWNPNHIFVFGSNEQGIHGAGAAAEAAKKYGAERGVGRGLTGRSYALPTKRTPTVVKPGEGPQIPLDELADNFDELYRTIVSMPDKTFFFTPVGTGLAGYTPEQIGGILRRYKWPKNFVMTDEAIEKIGSLASDKPRWARKAQDSYEVSSSGDKRFSAGWAEFSDGRTIEDIYQVDVKGGKKTGPGRFDYSTKGNDPMPGSLGSQLTAEQLNEVYTDLWRQFFEENPQLLREIAQKARGKVITDSYLSPSRPNQARAIDQILRELGIR